MTAISKAWVTLTDAATDADSPVDQALMQGYRDDLVHLREWLGASYYAGAVQDHNHDGSNSALVEIGPNYLRNGSFEDGTSGWTLTNYTGGSNALSTTNQYDGEQSLELTSTVLANGGAYATSNAYLPVSGGEVRALNFALMASAANVSSKVEAIWYDKDQAQISVSTLLSNTTTPTSWTRERLGCVAPAAARYMRLRFTGGVPAVGSSTGTVRFDGISLSAAGSGLLKVQEADIPASSSSLDLVMTDYMGHRNKTIVLNRIRPSSDSVSLLLRFSSNGGSSYDSGAIDYGYSYSTIDSTPVAVDAGQFEATMVVAPGFGNGSGEEGSGIVELFDTTDASARTRFYARMQYIDATTAARISRAGGARYTAQDTDAVRFYFASGNIAGGRYSLYLWN